MDLEFLVESISFGSILAAMGKGADLIEESLPQSTEGKIGDLGSASTYALYEWIKRIIPAIVAKVIGGKPWSWRAWSRILIYSFFCSFFLYFITTCFHPIVWDHLAAFDWPHWFVEFIINFIIFNAIADYVAFLKTNWLLTRLKGKPKIMQAMGWFIFDFVVTFLLGFLKFLPLLIFHYKEKGYHFSDLLSFFFKIVLPLKEFAGPKEVNHLNLVPGVFFYSTFLSSLFVWLLIFSSSLLNRKFWQNCFLRHIIDVKNKPVKSIKTIFFITVFCCWVLVNVVVQYIWPLVVYVHSYF